MSEPRREPRYSLNIEPVNTVDVDTFFASVEMHPELSAIRERLATNSITTTEIHDALTRANPALLDNLRAAKAEADRRRNQRR